MENKKGLKILGFISAVTILLIILNFFLPDILGILNINTKPAESEKLTIKPELVEGAENIYSVDINFRTQDDDGNTNKISAVSFSLTYPADPNNKVEIVDINGNIVNQVKWGQEIEDDEKWEVPVNTVLRTSEGVTVDFAAAYISTEGFSSVNGTTLATIYFKAEEPLQEDQFILNFNSDNTVILTKTSPTKNIRSQNDLYYSVEE